MYQTRVARRFVSLSKMHLARRGGHPIPKMRSLTISALAASCALFAAGPIGSPFPAVEATALDGKKWTLPQDLAGKPAVFLIGYKQKSQFDIDRWLIGLRQLRTPVRYFELPTIKGMLPGMFAGSIDNGMRSGIPREDWNGVIAIYRDAGKIVSLLGDKNPLNARVVLIDEKGAIRWFHDRGFSAEVLEELDTLVRK